MNQKYTTILFDIVLANTSIEAESTLYIDDREGNIKEVTKRGMRGIFYRSFDQLMWTVNELQLL